MRSNLKLVVNNQINKIQEKQFFEKEELKIIFNSFFKKKCFSSNLLLGLFITNFKLLRIDFMFID